MSVCCPIPVEMPRRAGAPQPLRLRLRRQLASQLLSTRQRAVRAAIVLGYLAQHPDGRCSPALLLKHLPWLARRYLLRLCIALLLDLLGITALVNVTRSLASLRASSRPCVAKALVHDEDETGG